MATLTAILTSAGFWAAVSAILPVIIGAWQRRAGRTQVIADVAAALAPGVVQSVEATVVKPHLEATQSATLDAAGIKKADDAAMSQLSSIMKNVGVQIATNPAVLSAAIKQAVAYVLPHAPKLPADAAANLERSGL